MFDKHLLHLQKKNTEIQVHTIELTDRLLIATVQLLVHRHGAPAVGPVAAALADNHSANLLILLLKHPKELLPPRPHHRA